MSESTPVPVKDFEALIQSKLKTSPEEFITAEGTEWAPTDKIPGFETMTFEIAEVYEVTWSMLDLFRKAKDEVFQATLVPTSIGIHLVRGFSRREWAEIQKEVISDSEARAKQHGEIKSNTNWMNKDIELHNEEQIVLKGCVVPKYDKISLRGVPAGVVTVLSAACIQACGFDTKKSLPPLKL